MSPRTRATTLAAVLALALLAAACGNSPESADNGGGTMSGSITVDGSSTVAPLTDAIAEEYAAEEPDVTVNVGVSGTGGGFERFCAGELDIANASRPIKESEEQACADAGIRWTELRVATDALTVVTNPATDFVDCLTFDELEHIWRVDDPATTWDQVRNGFPSSTIEVFAPDTDSGTYDFFTEEVLGKDAESRQDYNASADDNIIAQGIIGTPDSWGFFGFAYFEESADSLKALAVDHGEGCVEPSAENAMAGTYPLSRPLFLYVRNDALTKPELAGFLDYYLTHVNDVVEEVGYIPLTDAVLSESRSALEAASA